MSEYFRSDITCNSVVAAYLLIGYSALGKSGNLFEEMSWRSWRSRVADALATGVGKTLHVFR